jgi:RNA polymerase sigma-70 factor (ECF subfamily)
METGPTDEELMLRYGAGDAGAFDLLYGRHKGRLYRYLRRQSGAEGVADELFQDVWMRVIDARDRYEPRAKFTTWLFTIAHNRLMDHFRGSSRVALQSYDDDPEPVDAVAADTLSPEDDVARKQRAARILAAIDALPAAQREAFVLQQEGEMSVEEIAQATGVNRETAKSRLRYALAKLRAALGETQ